MEQQQTSTHLKEVHWRKHIARWERSGDSQRVYCVRNDLALSTFQLWRRRLATASTRVAGPVATSCLDIVPLRLPASALSQQHELVLVLDGGRHRLEIGAGVRAETLRTVLSVLEAR